MFRPDVKQFQEFYKSPPGKMFRRLLELHIREIWADIFAAENVTDHLAIGIGYTKPYLSMFLPRTKKVLSLMPAQQGAVLWPKYSNLTALVKDNQLPLADSSVGRLLLVHGLEYTSNIKVLFREIWRIMAPEGRILLVVPNRSGLWARSEKTPLGFGHPFSKLQIKALLEDSMFSLVRMELAVFPPPVNSRIILRNASLLEKMGSYSCNALGGVIIVEAKKEIYAAAKTADRQPAKDFVTAI